MEIILGRTSGFCFGVKNAIDSAEKELKINNNLYCLGEIVHNEEVIKDLEKKGLVIIDDINAGTGKVIIRAHGVSKDVYKIAQSKGIELLDFTCPFVSKIHDTVVQYMDNNYFIFLCGNKNHPETIGTISFCGDNSFIIEDITDVDTALKSFESSCLTDLLIISQTTFSVTLFESIVDTIKASLSPKVNFVVKNTICNTTSMRQKEAESLSKEVDLMIVIGGKHSSNTKKLYEIAQKNCKNSILVQTKDDLNYEYLQGFDRIGVIAGASTPQNVIDDILLFCKK